MMTIERRTAIELRAGGDAKSPRPVGHAAIFGSMSQDLGGFKEIIRPGAFTRSLAAADHDQLALVQCPRLLVTEWHDPVVEMSDQQINGFKPD